MRILAKFPISFYKTKLKFVWHIYYSRNFHKNLCQLYSKVQLLIFVFRLLVCTAFKNKLSKFHGVSFGSFATSGIPTYNLKAILQVLIYKALYDKSYLGSKTTMTSGELTCLISFALAPLTCSERGGSEKFKMKIYVSSGIRTHTPPVHDRKVRAP